MSTYFYYRNEIRMKTNWRRFAHIQLIFKIIYIIWKLLCPKCKTCVYLRPLRVPWMKILFAGFPSQLFVWYFHFNWKIRCPQRRIHQHICTTIVLQSGIRYRAVCNSRCNLCTKWDSCQKNTSGLHILDAGCWMLDFLLDQRCHQTVVVDGGFMATQKVSEECLWLLEYILW